MSWSRPVRAVTARIASSPTAPTRRKPTRMPGPGSGQVWRASSIAPSTDSTSPPTTNSIAPQWYPLILGARHTVCRGPRGGATRRPQLATRRAAAGGCQNDVGATHESPKTKTAPTESPTEHSAKSAFPREPAGRRPRAPAQSPLSHHNGKWGKELL